MKQLTDFSTQKLITKIMKWGTEIVFVVAIIIMAYLSFVEDFELKTGVRNITIISIMAVILNLLVWDSRYRYDYDKILTSDITAKDYSIHRRYYFARKGLKYEDLQNKIHKYNKDFVDAWMRDVEDVTGRTIKEIEEGDYKHDHKLLIYKVKHHMYPKSGLKTPRDVLYILSVSGSGGMKIDVKKAEHKHAWSRIQKIIMSILSATLTASIAIQFVSEGWESACLTLILNLALLFFSLFFGHIAGVKGGKIKLSTAEQICELLEQWKNEPPSEEPFTVKSEETEEVDKSEDEKSKSELSIVKPEYPKERRIEII